MDDRHSSDDRQDARTGEQRPDALPHAPARIIRVGIADDHPITRMALRTYLREEEDIRVVGEAGSGREAIALVRTQQPDVLLLDLDMPGQSGIDALAMIKAQARSRKLGVLVLSGYPEQQYALPLLRNGASGYLNKCCEPAEIPRAIRHVAQSGRYITPQVAQLLADQALGPRDARLHDKLTVRELQVLLKVAQGLSTREVAGELFLSPKTVSAYRSRLLRRFGARSQSELTYYAVKQRLVD